MNHYLPDHDFRALVADLTDAFMRAATSATTDLHDQIAEALANAGILPESADDEAAA